MPGYGFAFAKEEKQKNWNELINEYLINGKNIKNIFLLIDSRHGLKANDKKMIEFLESNKIKFQIILTKTDLMKLRDLVHIVLNLKKFISNLKFIDQKLFMISSVSKSGIAKLKEYIVDSINFDMEIFKIKTKRKVFFLN
jgi:GTP-binding protein